MGDIAAGPMTHLVSLYTFYTGHLPWAWEAFLLKAIVKQFCGIVLGQIPVVENNYTDFLLTSSLYSVKVFDRFDNFRSKYRDIKIVLHEYGQVVWSI